MNGMEPTIGIGADRSLTHIKADEGTVRHQGGPVSEEDVRQALMGVEDPEAGMSVLDLGLVYGIAIEPGSVIGKQITLYTAQANGFDRDAEQKAAKVMIDSWNVRRTTDVGTVADGVNQLHDANVGRAVNALLGGVGA